MQESIVRQAGGASDQEVGRRPCPVLHSIPDPHAVADRVGRAYGLDEIEDCRLLKPGRNDTYLLRAGKKRFTFRLYAAGREPEDVAGEIALIRHLAADGVAVAAAVARRDGGDMLVIPAPEGQRRGVLFTFAPGQPARGNDHEWGRTVARFHAASNDFICPRRRTPAGLDYLLDQPLRWLHALLLERPDDWSYLTGVARRLRVLIRQIPSGSLDWGPCHLDLVAANAHRASDGSVTLFDFDLWRPGWRAFDVARFQGEARQAARPDRWEAFLRGYRSVRDFGPLDEAAVALFVPVQIIWTMGLQASNSLSRGTWKLDDRYFDARFEALRTLDRDMLRSAP